MRTSLASVTALAGSLLLPCLMLGSSSSGNRRAGIGTAAAERKDMIGFELLVRTAIGAGISIALHNDSPEAGVSARSAHGRTSRECQQSNRPHRDVRKVRAWQGDQQSASGARLCATE